MSNSKAQRADIGQVFLEGGPGGKITQGHGVAVGGHDLVGATIWHSQLVGAGAQHHGHVTWLELLDRCGRKLCLGLGRIPVSQTPGSDVVMEISEKTPHPLAI